MNLQEAFNNIRLVVREHKANANVHDALRASLLMIEHALFKRQSGNPEAQNTTESAPAEQTQQPS